MQALTPNEVMAAIKPPERAYRKLRDQESWPYKGNLSFCYSACLMFKYLINQDDVGLIWPKLDLQRIRDE
ncbi:hypothetical protein [Photobacterium arenosum]|uniref:hypothetical protein n=1 Tax=Photobacterium arenosum TaxID=2774143 RepID=UPI002889E321|nr:hypothetical protein [Photobacterium arenosum]